MSRMFNLIENKEFWGIQGTGEPMAFRTWSDFDASTLTDKDTDTLIEPCSNGLIYKAKLNTNFDPAAKTFTMNPELTKFNYKTSYHIPSMYGAESSPLMYRNLFYIVDGSGTILCMDINTLEPAWIAHTLGDGNATMVLEETEDGVFLYEGNSVDQANHLNCNLRKFNALTGEQIWQYDIPCIFTELHGGLLATPLIGKDDISNMIIFNVARTKSENSGELVALDKKTGKPVWIKEQNTYSWSSPISIKGDDGKTYGIYCDFLGNMHLFDPKTGEDYDKISLGLNVEASPSAYNNMIVVGTYAQKIYGVKIK